jgi:hypothetical protein
MRASIQAFALPCVLFGLLASACIERPTSPSDKRAKLDRSGLADLLVREPPASARRVGARFGSSVELSGLEVSPARPRPGGTVSVQFYYRVLDEAEEDYRVFVHAEPHGVSERINADHWPAGGRYPTSAWRRGELIRDSWSFKVPSYYEGDGVDLWTGFYLPAKDERWPLSNAGEVRHDGQNRVLAGSIPVGR